MPAYILTLFYPAILASPTYFGWPTKYFHWNPPCIPMLPPYGYCCRDTTPVSLIHKYVMSRSLGGMPFCNYIVYPDKHATRRRTTRDYFLWYLWKEKRTWKVKEKERKENPSEFRMQESSLPQQYDSIIARGHKPHAFYVHTRS